MPRHAASRNPSVSWSINLYDPGTIEANHETFAHDGTVVRSSEVDALMTARFRRSGGAEAQHAVADL